MLIKPDGSVRDTEALGGNPILAESAQKSVVLASRFRDEPGSLYRIRSERHELTPKKSSRTSGQTIRFPARCFRQKPGIHLRAGRRMPGKTFLVQRSRERRELELQLQRQLKDAGSRDRTGHLPEGC